MKHSLKQGVVHHSALFLIVVLALLISIVIYFKAQEKEKSAEPEAESPPINYFESN